ncbi:MAG: hypothetical protein JNM55_08585 [Anaerolineales bacterium]|nr:hypothetical protein [Anaerolineales bacterium]
MLPILIYLILAISALLLPLKHYSNYKRASISKDQAWGGLGWDILKIFMIVFLVSFLGKTGAIYASGFAESRWQGTGALVGFIALLVVSVLIANGIKWGMEKLGKFLRLA